MLLEKSDSSQTDGNGMGSGQKGLEIEKAMLGAKLSLRARLLSCVPVLTALVFVCWRFGADLSALKAMLEHEHKAQRPSNAISQ